MRVALTLALCLLTFSLGVLSRPFIKRLKDRIIPPRHVEKRVGNSERYARKDEQVMATDFVRRIVFLGDSRIEEGRWEELLGRQDVSNRGISGDATTDILDRLDASIPEAPALCVVQAGINDLNRGTAITRVVENYKQILNFLTNKRQTDVILTSVILADERHPELNSRIVELNSRLSQLVDNKGIRWLDLNASLSPSGHLEGRFTNDGIHFNAEGYKAIARRIAPLLPNKR
jgi:lysophospholipase L1-like esterase